MDLDSNRLGPDVDGTPKGGVVLIQQGGFEQSRRVTENDRSFRDVCRLSSHGQGKAKENVGKTDELHLDDSEVIARRKKKSVE